MTIRDELAEENPEALLLDGFDEALLGIGRRCGQPALAVYSRVLIIQILIDDQGMTYEDALEHYDFNIAGGWAGEHTPLIVDTTADEDEGDEIVAIVDTASDEDEDDE